MWFAVDENNDVVAFTSGGCGNIPEFVCCSREETYLELHGIRKLPRQDGKNPLFDPMLNRRILKNPVYYGKIAYGRRKTEKVLGTRNDYPLVEQDNNILVDGLHEPIVSEELWQAVVEEVRIYEERQPNGQWLKSIKFRLPIIEENLSISLDKEAQAEGVVLLSKHS